MIKEYMTSQGLDIERIIDEYYPYVYKLASNLKSMHLSTEDLEEIISDTFYAIWKSSNNINNEILLKPYLAGIVKNITRNKYRTTVINETIEDYENDIKDNHTIEEIIEEREENKLIKDILIKMKKDEYDIFLMFYYEGKKIKEIAHKMDFSENKVKVILHRVRKKLKKSLKNRGYTYGK